MLAVVVGGACRARDDAQPPAAAGEAWPEADILFRRDPRWLGGDAAFSVPLGDGRTSWLFGDTFVAKTPANIRAQSTLVRNTVGIQTGDDPRTAGMTFHWRGSATEPASYFPEEGADWFWPQHGIRLGRALVLFQMRVGATPGRGLGFEVEGWRAVVIDDPGPSAAAWRFRTAAPPVSPPGLVPGAALNVVGEHVVSLAIRIPGDHSGYLVRWRAAELAQGRLDDAEWWAGDRGWVPTASLGGSPARILDDAGAECSLHFDGRLQRWVHIRSEGFGATTIVVSFATKIEGPWSAPVTVFRPPESDRPDAFVYAGKGHPEQRGTELAVTYAANTLAGIGRLIADTSLYYPRFVRLTFP